MSQRYEGSAGAFHLLRGTRIGEADEGPAALGVEVDAGGRRDPALGQHAPAEGLAVAGQARDVGIGVEGPVAGCERAETGGRKRPLDDAAVAGVTRHVGLQLVLAVERDERGPLRKGRRRDEEVLRQPLHCPREVIGHNHPAEPPAGHREIF